MGVDDAGGLDVNASGVALGREHPGHGSHRVDRHSFAALVVFRPRPCGIEDVPAPGASEQPADGAAGPRLPTQPSTCRRRRLRRTAAPVQSHAGSVSDALGGLAGADVRSTDPAILRRTVRAATALRGLRPVARDLIRSWTRRYSQRQPRSRHARARSRRAGRASVDRDDAGAPPAVGGPRGARWRPAPGERPQRGTWPSISRTPGAHGARAARREAGQHGRLEEQRRCPELGRAVPPGEPGERSGDVITYVTAAASTRSSSQAHRHVQMFGSPSRRARCEVRRGRDPTVATGDGRLGRGHQRSGCRRLPL